MEHAASVGSQDIDVYAAQRQGDWCVCLVVVVLVIAVCISVDGVTNVCALLLRGMRVVTTIQNHKFLTKKFSSSCIEPIRSS